MPLGTIDRTPPPFFRQGPSALTKLVVCAALAVFLMVADRRFAVVQPMRAGLATVLLPLQRALMVPGELLSGGGAYLRGLEQAREAEAAADRRLVEVSAQARRADVLAAENDELRRLLGLLPSMPPRTVAAEVLYEARDAYSHKLVIGRGQTQGVVAGSPVLDADGVLGQVTRVYPLSAEVTLLTDKDARIPVLNPRTGLRAVAFGGAQGPAGPMLELRYLPAESDVKPGDPWVTNGLDGVFPPGWPVGVAADVERRGEGVYARVLLEPAATEEGVRHVLLLEPAPPTPALAASSAASAGSAAAGSASGPAPADGEAGPRNAGRGASGAKP